MRRRGRAPQPLAGVASSLTPALLSPPVASPLPSAGDQGREELGNCGSRGITGDGGDSGNQQEGSGAGGLSGHGVPTGRAPRPFRAAEERCLRHFILTLVSVDTCSSEAFLN